MVYCYAVRYIGNNLLMRVGIGCIAVMMMLGLLLVQGAQSQEKVQCESWLDELLTSQNGIHYILGKIHSIVLARTQGRVLSSPVQPQEPQGTGLQALHIGTKVTEQNDAYQKFAWTLKVKNTTDIGKSFTAKIQWLDADGFIVDDDVAYDLMLDANEEKQFAGYALIDADAASTATSVTAHIPPRYVTDIATVQIPQSVTGTISN